MEVTKYYQFPLQWDQYDDDRSLLREALIRIDAAIKTNDGGGTGAASQIIYDGAEASRPDEDVAEALDKLMLRTNTFEIAISYTASANTGEILSVYNVTDSFTLPATLTGSRGKVYELLPLTMNIRIDKNDTPIGNIVIDNSVLSFDFPADVTFAFGDTLTFVSTDTTTFRCVAVTLLAVELD
jgi:hypothetical protein